MTTIETIDKLVRMAENGKTSFTFQSKDARKLVAAKLRKLGYKVRYSSIRNQRLHPEYVDDWEYDVDSGFGNVQYRTWFTVLYNLYIHTENTIGW